LPGIIGMAAALEAGSEWMEKAAALRLRLEQALVEGGAEIVGSASPRSPAIGAYRMPGAPSNSPAYPVRHGGSGRFGRSACSSGSLKRSHVLAAMGWGEATASEVVRVSFGRSTTEEEVDRFIELWRSIAARRRAA
jgi:cysteine desulfurase